MNPLSINNRLIGPGYPVYFIAEISANHHQSFNRAVEIVRAAKEAGADAIKLQTYTADTLTIDHDAPCFRVGKGTQWEGRSLYDLYREAYTPWDWQPKLMAIAEELGIDCFSSPFDATAVDFLEKMQVPAWKIASFELVDHALIRLVAKTGKPLIMSTGMATLAEIEEAVQVARQAGAKQIALLKCTSGYPADPSEMNLRTIPHLAEAFDVVVGLSDHTLNAAVPVSAVALGASIVEKHIIISRSVSGPDSSFSLEPAEFRQMVDEVRIAERALGRIYYGVSERESASRVFRRSLFIVEDVRAGEKLTERNVRSIRPADGLPPKHLDEVIGGVARIDIARGTPLDWNLISRP